MKSYIVIVDYGLGNVSSISNMLEYLNINFVISNNIKSISEANKIIIPGVGSFDNSISLLRKTKIDHALKEAHQKNAIILGICLGMQVLFESSEEGKLKGLGILEGKIIKLENHKNIIVPHIGWNAINSNNLEYLNTHNKKFYFLHSYHPQISDRFKYETVNYHYNFPAIVNFNNIFGVQFHPEKSGKNGMSFFKRFNKL